MIPKKRLLMISLAGVVLFVVSLFAKELGLCSIVNTSCIETFDPVAENVLIFIPFLLLSLITYRMREEVYTAWFRFVRWWIPLSILLIFIAPEYSSDWMYPIEKGGVAFATSLIFCVVSLIIIAAKYTSFRKRSI